MATVNKKLDAHGTSCKTIHFELIWRVSEPFDHQRAETREKSERESFESDFRERLRAERERERD